MGGRNFFRRVVTIGRCVFVVKKPPELPGPSPLIPVIAWETFIITMPPASLWRKTGTPHASSGKVTDNQTSIRRVLLPKTSRALVSLLGTRCIDQHINHGAFLGFMVFEKMGYCLKYY